MKLKRFVFLPVFLCTALLFRMCFLSFGPVHSSTIAFHRSTSFKKKLLNNYNSTRRNLKRQTTTDFNLISSLNFSKHKAVLSRKLCMPQLPCLLSAVFFNTLPTLNLQTSSIEFIDMCLLSKKRHISISVLRI